MTLGDSKSGNVLDLWIVFLEGSQSIHGEGSYTIFQNLCHRSAKSKPYRERIEYVIYFEIWYYP